MRRWHVGPITVAWEPPPAIFAIGLKAIAYPLGHVMLELDLGWRRLWLFFVAKKIEP